VSSGGELGVVEAEWLMTETRFKGFLSPAIIGTEPDQRFTVAQVPQLAE